MGEMIGVACLQGHRRGEMLLPISNDDDGDDLHDVIAGVFAGTVC